MATRALQTEDIAWALHAAITADLPAALAAVEAWRNAQDRLPLLLPPPVRIDMGFDELAFTLPPESYPRISIIAAPLSPDRPLLGDQRMAEAVHTALVEWLIFVGNRAGIAPQDIKQEAVIMAWRYGEALLSVLRDNSPFAGFEMGSIAPQVDEGQPTALRLNRNNAQEITGFLAGGTASLVLRGTYTA